MLSCEGSRKLVVSHAAAKRKRLKTGSTALERVVRPYSGSRMAPMVMRESE